MRSHAAGVGEPLPRGRGARHAAAARQHAGRGATPASAPRLHRRAAASCSTAACIPVVPSQGSVGASGDLAPLAHLALALIGEGEARGSTARVLPGRRGAGARRPRAAGARAQGRPGADQRHPGDDRARLALALLDAAAPGARRRRGRRAVDRRAARHRRAPSTRASTRVARTRARRASAAQPLAAAAGLGHPRVAPRRATARAGRLLAALHAAGARRGARRARRRRASARDRDELGDRQPAGLRRRRRDRLGRQLPRRAGGASPPTSSPSRWPSSPRSPSAASSSW